jgi:hypothetical protein
MAARSVGSSGIETWRDTGYRHPFVTGKRVAWTRRKWLVEAEGLGAADEARSRRALASAECHIQGA